MERVNTEWLPHLAPEAISGIEGNYLDAYVVALEGWRRGLTLRWHVKDSEKFKEMKTWYVDQPGQLFSLHSDEKTHYFFRTRGDKVSNDAVEKGMDKQITKRMLYEANIPVPEGKEYTKDAQNNDMLSFANRLGYPVVLKPTDGSFGRGVIADIRGEGELQYSIDYLRKELSEDNIILEKYIPGKDYRLYVVGNQVVGAILRLPPNVVGDGINSIASLIEIKNAERSLNPRLVSCPISINQETNDYIGRSGLTMDTVPEKGSPVYLSDKGNISLGGDPIDVLDELSEEAKETAIRALQAIPGLEHGAVDLIIGETESGEETISVIELNPTAQIGGILFPLQGKPRDIPAAIIDYYFPETKDVKTDKKKMYFDFYAVLEPLISRQGSTSTVTPAPQGTIHMKKYTVFGDVQDLGYHMGLRKQAFERGLHGFVMNVDEGVIDIVVASTDKEMVDDFEHGIFEDEERATVIEIQTSEYDKFVNVGFDSQANHKTIAEELDVLTKEIEQLNQEIRELEVQKRKLHRSTSWVITSPIRAAGAIAKLVKR